MDLYQLACLHLTTRGVSAIYGGGFCTYRDPARFFSYPRHKQTGRMARLIYLSS
jgi:copper oxidase (laccase) domain-containing protein